MVGTRERGKKSIHPYLLLIILGSAVFPPVLVRIRFESLPGPITEFSKVPPCPLIFRSSLILMTSPSSDVHLSQGLRVRLFHFFIFFMAVTIQCAGYTSTYDGMPSNYEMVLCGMNVLSW